MKGSQSSAVTFVALTMVVVGAVGSMASFGSQQIDYRTAGSSIVASRVEISHDFTTCMIQFANEGNLTDTTRSVLLFYVEEGTEETIVRNADPSPSVTIPPGGTVDWNCVASFAGSPPGIPGAAVNAVVSAVVSRERSSYGNFT